MKKTATNFISTGTYISKIDMKKFFLKINIQLIIGGLFSLFFLFGIYQGIVGENEVLRDGILTSVAMCVPFLLLFLAGIRNRQKVRLIRRYNSIFMCDLDGMVTIDEIARQIGKAPSKILSELEWLFQKGMFCDCTLQITGTPGVILAGKGENRTSFVNIVCEKCNGTTRLRAGTSGKCEYCGSAISSRNIGS